MNGGYLAENRVAISRADSGPLSLLRSLASTPGAFSFSVVYGLAQSTSQLAVGGPVAIPAVDASALAATAATAGSVSTALTGVRNTARPGSGRTRSSVAKPRLSPFQERPDALLPVVPAGQGGGRR